MSTIKRTPAMTDEQWEKMLEDRKRLAEKRMAEFDREKQ